MSDKYFPELSIKESDCPANVVPAGAKPIIGIDYASDGDTTVKGFYQDGIYHIQEVIESNQK